METLELEMLVIQEMRDLQDPAAAGPTAAAVAYMAAQEAVVVMVLVEPATAVEMDWKLVQNSLALKPMHSGVKEEMVLEMVVKEAMVITFQLLQLVSGPGRSAAAAAVAAEVAADLADLREIPGLRELEMQVVQDLQEHQQPLQMLLQHHKHPIQLASVNQGQDL